MTTRNVHLKEIQKFGAQAERWWDSEGEFKTLHQVNPLRLSFIQRHIDLNGQRVVDVGCGGGILTEALAKAGADALGIDLSEDLLDIADLHSLESGLSTVRYQCISAETLAEQQSAQFDHVTCMEMLEHVPDPQSIVQSCAQLVKPGGWVFFSTLNRAAKAYWLAIVAAEHVLQMVPKGTHDYQTFIKPSELSRMARLVGLETMAITGIEYQPFNKQFRLGQDIDVNYIIACQKTAP
jgi:2-polyprenyl-6-hydroxyphenyl methylase / 3-demethylubiquinone-9 3-methyltransferase